MASARPSRRPGSWTRTTAAVAAVGVLALTGCSATNPITTATAYNVVDGVQARLTDQLAAENLIVFTSEEGAPGAMGGALVNRTRESVEYTLDIAGGESVEIEVPAGGTVLLGEAGERVMIDRVEAAPGASLPVRISTPDAGSVDVPVPVFDGTLPEYQDQVPESDS